MTHKDHAEKVWKAARDAAQCEDIDGDEKDAIRVIAAALQKQRVACWKSLNWYIHDMDAPQDDVTWRKAIYDAEVADD